MQRSHPFLGSLYETEKALALLGLPASTGIEAADLLEHARSRSESGSSARADLSFHETSLSHSFRPFGDAVQPLTLIEQHADRPEDAGLVGMLNDLGVKRERRAMEKRQRKAAEKLVKAEEKGKKQKKIDKVASRTSSLSPSGTDGSSRG